MAKGSIVLSELIEKGWRTTSSVKLVVSDAQLGLITAIAKVFKAGSVAACTSFAMRSPSPVRVNGRWCSR